MENELLFRIVERESNKTYSIYSDGTIEWFAPGCYVINRYAGLMKTQPLQSEKGILSIDCSQTSRHSPFLDGAGHSSPL